MYSQSQDANIKSKAEQKHNPAVLWLSQITVSGSLLVNLKVFQHTVFHLDKRQCTKASQLSPNDH